MTDENFLHRWFRRKDAARDETGPSRGPQDEAQDTGHGQEAPGAETAAFDPSTLPPIESLDGTSDYTAFLKADVPKVLRQAALRKAWSSNAAITGHKPLVDYDWDFHAPGYGKLWPIDDPARFIAGLFARAPSFGQETPETGPEVDDGAGNMGAAIPPVADDPAPPDADVERPADTGASPPDSAIS